MGLQIHDVGGPLSTEPSLVELLGRKSSAKSPGLQGSWSVGSSVEVGFLTVSPPTDHSTLTLSVAPLQVLGLLWDGGKVKGGGRNSETQAFGCCSGSLLSNLQSRDTAFAKGLVAPVTRDHHEKILLSWGCFPQVQLSSWCLRALNIHKDCRAVNK